MWKGIGDVQLKVTFPKAACVFVFYSRPLPLIQPPLISYDSSCFSSFFELTSVLPISIQSPGKDSSPASSFKQSWRQWPEGLWPHRRAALGQLGQALLGTGGCHTWFGHSCLCLRNFPRSLLGGLWSEFARNTASWGWGWRPEVSPAWKYEAFNW